MDKGLSSERHVVFDIAKGVLIFLMVIGHVIQWRGIETGDYWTDPVFVAIYSFHMPLFLIISGFFLKVEHCENIFNGELTKRASCYILPIATFALMFSNLRGEAFLKNMLEQFWFLWAIFFCYILVAAIVYSCKFLEINSNWGRGSFLIIAALICTVFAPNNGNLYLVKFSVCFFVAGFLLRINKIDVASFKYSVLFVLFIFYAVGLLFWNESFFVYKTKMKIFDGNWQYIVYRIIIAMTFFPVFMKGCFIFSKFAAIKFLFGYFGKNSAVIYISQAYIFELAYRSNFRIENMHYFHIIFIGFLVCFLACFSWYLLRKSVASFLLYGKN